VFERGQLLRSSSQLGEEVGDAGERLAGAMMLTVALVIVTVVWLACWVCRPMV
jgi:hypothetical protein